MRPDTKVMNSKENDIRAAPVKPILLCQNRISDESNHVLQSL